jgi:DNA-binding MarR family transcriptional regulator
MSEKGSDAVDRIIEDLHQLFPDLDPIGLPIVGRILRASRFLEARRETQLADYGLTAADFDVLAALRRTTREVAAVNVRELQQSVMMSSGGMTKRLDRLEGNDLIERHPDPQDRRGVLIALTPTGRDRIDTALVAVLDAESALITATNRQAKSRTQTAAGLRDLLVELEAEQ